MFTQNFINEFNFNITGVPVTNTGKQYTITTTDGVVHNLSKSSDGYTYYSWPGITLVSIYDYNNGTNASASTLLVGIGSSTAAESVDDF